MMQLDYAWLILDAARSAQRFLELYVKTGELKHLERFRFWAESFRKWSAWRLEAREGA